MDGFRPLKFVRLLDLEALMMLMSCLHVYRVKKLKETLATVEQLDKNMNNLRSWLSRVEAELSRPLTYSVCHQQEIQRRLAEQQVRYLRLNSDVKIWGYSFSVSGAVWRKCS